MIKNSFGAFLFVTEKVLSLDIESILVVICVDGRGGNSGAVIWTAVPVFIEGGRKQFDITAVRYSCNENLGLEETLVPAGCHSLANKCKKELLLNQALDFVEVHEKRRSAAKALSGDIQDEGPASKNGYSDLVRRLAETVKTKGPSLEADKRMQVESDANIFELNLKIELTADEDKTVGTLLAQMTSQLADITAMLVVASTTKYSLEVIFCTHAGLQLRLDALHVTEEHIVSAMKDFFKQV